MSFVPRLIGFMRKPAVDKWAAIQATLLTPGARDRRRLHRLLSGPQSPPQVLRGSERMYVAYRPDSDFVYKNLPELGQLSEQWVKNNLTNNGGDLPRLYAIALNVKQVLADGVPGDMAELGVYRGNSAAVIAHYARLNRRKVLLFDTFEGFDRRDLTGTDQSKNIEFSDTSLDAVRAIVGEDNVDFVKGWFPDSIPDYLHGGRFCFVHIDCDLYEPAKAGLEFFYARLSPGGLLVMHDYANPYWPGIKRALDEFCRDIPERPIILADKSGTAMLRKSASHAL